MLNTHFSNPCKKTTPPIEERVEIKQKQIADLKEKMLYLNVQNLLCLKERETLLKAEYIHLVEDTQQLEILCQEEWRTLQECGRAKMQVAHTKIKFLINDLKHFQATEQTNLEYFKLRRLNERREALIDQMIYTPGFVGFIMTNTANFEESFGSDIAANTYLFYLEDAEKLAQQFYKKGSLNIYPFSTLLPTQQNYLTWHEEKKEIVSSVQKSFEQIRQLTEDNIVQLEKKNASLYKRINLMKHEHERVVKVYNKHWFRLFNLVIDKFAFKTEPLLLKNRMVSMNFGDEPLRANILKGFTVKGESIAKEISALMDDLNKLGGDFKEELKF